MQKITLNSGFTLVEVIMVIIILGIMAAVAMKSLDSGLESTRIEETKTEMRHLAQAISGNPELYADGIRTDFGYVGDVGSMPASLDMLVTDPGYATWRGPYINSDFTNYSDDFKQDAWGKDYIYAGGTSIKSTGMSADTISYLLTSSVSNFLSNSVEGRISDAVGNPPGDSSTSISVTLSYPNGVGGVQDSTVNPNSSGYFSFPSGVPIGNHTVTAVYATTDDTVINFISVLPKSQVKTSLRFPGALWAAEEGGSGSGSGSGDLEYVSGSASVSGTGYSDISFSISNLSADAKTITWMKLTFSGTAYFEQVSWEGSTVFYSNNPRSGSDEQVALSSAQYIAPYAPSVDIEVRSFEDTPSGSGSNVDMRSIDITVEFSDGSVITFNTDD